MYLKTSKKHTLGCPGIGVFFGCFSGRLAGVARQRPRQSSLLDAAAASLRGELSAAGAAELRGGVELGELEKLERRVGGEGVFFGFVFWMVGV